MSLENLVRSQLYTIRSDLTDVQASLGEIEARSTNVEGNLVLVTRHLGQLAAADAQQQVPIHRMTERLVHIERRLDLRDVWAAGYRSLRRPSRGSSECR